MSRPHAAPPEVIHRVKALIERDGVPETSRRLKLSRQTIAAIVGGLPVSAGSIAVVNASASQSDPPPASSAA